MLQYTYAYQHEGAICCMHWPTSEPVWQEFPAKVLIDLGARPIQAKFLSKVAGRDGHPCVFCHLGTCTIGLAVPFALCVVPQLFVSMSHLRSQRVTCLLALRDALVAFSGRPAY